MQRGQIWVAYVRLPYVRFSVLSGGRLSSHPPECVLSHNRNAESNIPANSLILQCRFSGVFLARCPGIGALPLFRVFLARCPCNRRVPGRQPPEGPGVGWGCVSPAGRGMISSPPGLKKPKNYYLTGAAGWNYYHENYYERLPAHLPALQPSLDRQGGRHPAAVPSL